jgi:phosphate transport system substrate-binding protein
VKIPKDLGISTINGGGANAYPIATQTFVDVYKDLCKAGTSQAEAKAVVSFLNYGLGAGQQVAKQLSYAPLPPAVVGKSKAAVTTLQCNGAPLT